MLNKYLLITGCLILCGLGSVISYADHCVLSTSDVTTIYFGVEISLPDPNHPITTPDVHTDIEIPLLFEKGWDIYINSGAQGGTATRIETEDALIPVYERHQFSFPGSIPSGYEFIGAVPDETFWYRPQSGDAGSPGYDSQEMTSDETDELCLWDPNDPAGNSSGFQKWLQVNLIDVRGPAGGHVSMWQESVQGPKVFFSTYDGGITEKDVYFILATSHAHNNWGFTKAGLYEVDIQVSTYHLCDDTLIADVNGDCKINFKDFVLMAGQWLACGSSFGSECP